MGYRLHCDSDSRTNNTAAAIGNSNIVILSNWRNASTIGNWGVMQTSHVGEGAPAPSPSFSVPPFPSSFPFFPPLLFSPFPLIPLEVGPLIAARGLGSGERFVPGRALTPNGI